MTRHCNGKSGATCRRWKATGLCWMYTLFRYGGLLLSLHGTLTPPHSHSGWLSLPGPVWLEHSSSWVAFSTLPWSIIKYLTLYIFSPWLSPISLCNATPIIPLLILLGNTRAPKTFEINELEYKVPCHREATQANRTSRQWLPCSPHAVTRK